MILADHHRITVAVAGAGGRMGTEAVRALAGDPRFELAAVLVRDAGQARTSGRFSCPVYDDPEHLLMEVHPDVWLDLTDARSVVGHIDRCISFGVRPVIGATGYTQADVARWDEACRRQGIGGIAAPNFAIGALLMMRFAAEAARFFKRAEIIELHHDQKRDAPSGTARRTAEQMAQQRREAAAGPSAALDEGTPPASAESLARGLAYHEIPIHSVRLPGLVAHQEVIFGGEGEVLTIRHDSLSRQSFMPGVLLACARVRELTGMVYGLEHLLW
ncbi:4-hydroxy-tetrahydrodipicolinate reductase [Alicyclobacillus sp.]|uniref:4-hydroxy-tetrahydrodipicolinate reductase n=1 Tax=Alicyclobacillus sp. TaxID=61169 RepID=UPI0025BC6BEF|nr:4-hydroxy-tetrahydrodipicolinate reductase [Alicyclobacillus sp.]MCL6515531.1 4-hydroxy-tetrahydrodipicolinate reductase [Alicyclobacillus sp.]